MNFTTDKCEHGIIYMRCECGARKVFCDDCKKETTSAEDIKYDDMLSNHKEFNCSKTWTADGMPVWMIPGARFTADNSKCIYIGHTKWRDTERTDISVGGAEVGRVDLVVFRDKEHVFCYEHKNEWHMDSFEHDPQDNWIGEAVEGWVE